MLQHIRRKLRSSASRRPVVWQRNLGPLSFALSSNRIMLNTDMLKHNLRVTSTSRTEPTMPDFRRYFVPGGMYFFTLVTADRMPLFNDESARTILGKVIREELKAHTFELVSMVLLPDHLHAIWSLPPGDASYDDRWKAIKAKFSMEWLASGGVETMVAPGYKKQRRRGVWQPRFMEHTIKDQADLHHHVDYLHWNPVKHRMVKCPKDWPWSSFHRLVKSGDYPLDWGCSNAAPPDFSRVDVGLIE